MRRTWISLLIVTLVSLLTIGCGQGGGGGSTAGGNDSESLLGLLPQTATGVFYVDVQKAMTIPATKDALAENHDKLDEFIADTGIDPSRDVFSVAGALTGQAKADGADGVAVMKVKADADALITRIEEENGELTEEDHEGVTVYNLPEDDGKPVSLSFLDDATVVIGSPSEVRAVIDVYQKRADSVLKNPELMAVAKTANQDALFWAAFVVSKEDMEELTSGNSMLGQLGGIESVTMSFDYRDQMFMALIECQSENEEKNQQIADFLTGIKSFASMGASEKPELGELLRAIEITPGPQNVRIKADIPEELMERLEGTPTEES